MSKKITLHDVGNEMPTVQTLCGVQTQAIHALEKKAASLESLCGTMIATLKLNRLRGYITSRDDKHFDDMIESWSTQLEKL